MAIDHIQETVAQINQLRSCFVHLNMIPHKNPQATDQESRASLTKPGAISYWLFDAITFLPQYSPSFHSDRYRRPLILLQTHRY